MDTAGDEDVVSEVGGGEFVVAKDSVGQLNHLFVKNEGAEFKGGHRVSGGG